MLAPVILISALWQLCVVSAERVITSSSLVSCMANNNITSNRFSINFWPGNGTLEFDVDVNIAFNGTSSYVVADVSAYAYGINIIQKTIDPCGGANSLKQLCPVYAGQIELKSSTTLGSDVLSQIPGIAFTFPDIDAYAIVKILERGNNTQIGCVRIDLSNTKTVATTAVKWVTACISGAAIVASIIFLYFGSIGTSQHIFAVSSLMYQYFQSQALLNLENVERVPPMANAWSENLAWSLGLIYNKTLQKVFRWYIQATGGTPSTYKIYPTIAVLPQRMKRSLDYAGQQVPRVRDFLEWTTKAATNNVVGHLENGLNLMKRENELAQEMDAKSSDLLLVLRGIKRAGYNMGIEYTSIVITAFVTFWFFLFAIAVIFGCVWVGFWILHRQSKDYFRHRHAAAFTPYIGSVFKGVMLYCCFMGMAPILTFSLWEFIERDSAAVIVAAVVMLISIVVILSLAVWRILLKARTSIKETGTPAYLLYSDLHFRHHYSFLYGPYNASYYWFLPVYMASMTIKSIVLGLGQGSGRAQALIIWVLEVAVLALMCWKKPYLNKATNVINIAMQVVIMLNSLFYLFFSNLFTQPLAVNGVMSIVYFILNAAFSLILLLYVLIYFGLCIFRKNPEAHITPAKDDRMSFIDEKIAVPGDNAELTALGAAAQADHDDTEVASETHNWFKTEEGANIGAGGPRAFGHQTARRFHSIEHLNTMTSDEGTSFRNSAVIDVPDIDTINAHVGNHRATNSQTTMDIMSGSGGFPGGNFPGDSNPSSPIFSTSDSLNPNGTTGHRSKKWWGR